MQDNNIKYLITAKDEASATFKKVQKNAELLNSSLAAMGSGALSGSTKVTVLSKANDDLAAQTDKASSATDRASKSQSNYFYHIAKTTVQSAIMNKLFLEFIDVTSQAIKQVDLMNNFPATMASMGQATDVSNESFKTLSDYVGKIGGSLADATSAVTRFTGVTGNVKSAVAIFTGLNNALIAGDSTLEEQRMAAIQFAQAFERGKPDMKEWLSLTQNMSQQLGIVAKSMGFASASALGESLREGTTNMGDFTTELVKLSTGQGEIAKQAEARMSGIQFSFNIMKNTLVQSVAAIINTFGRQNITGLFTGITSTVQILSSWIVTLMNAIGALINMIFGLFGAGDVFKQITGDLEVIGGGANGIKDGLDGANDSAKKLKNSLASFDKMNVLTEPKADDTNSGTSFSTAQTDALNAAFGEIAPNIQEASIWAKILASTIAGIAGLKLLEKIFGIDPKMMGKFAATLAKSIAGLATGGGSLVLDAASTVGNKIGNTIKDSVGKTKEIFKNVKDSLADIGKTKLSELKTAWKDVKDEADGALTKFKDIIKKFADIALEASKKAITTATAWTTAAAKSSAAWVADAATKSIAFISTSFKAAIEASKTAGAWVASAVASSIAWIRQKTIVFGVFLATKLQAAVSALAVSAVWIASAVATAAAWVIANAAIIGIWALVIAAIIGAVAIIIANWDSISKFFTDLWNGIMFGLSIVGAFFVSIFATAWQGIKDTFRNVGTFFTNVWNTIVDIFGKVGTAIGNAIGEAFKAVVNTIIGFAEGFINTFIDTINGAIKSIKDLSGGTISLGKVEKLKIPRLAQGGVVTQSTMANIGENGAEAIVPLENNTEWIDKLASKINGPKASNNNPDIIPVTNGQAGQPTNITINVSGVFATNPQEQQKIANLIAKQLNNTLKAKGLQGAY